MPITVCNESKNIQTYSAAMYSGEVMITERMNENPMQGKITLDSFETIRIKDSFFFIQAAPEEECC